MHIKKNTKSRSLIVLPFSRRFLTIEGNCHIVKDCSLIPGYSTVGENIIANIICKFLLPFKNDNFSNIAIAILDFSVFPPI